MSALRICQKDGIANRITAVLTINKRRVGLGNYKIDRYENI